ncbi:hypothetical protein JXA47_14235 [Candidatus Sumerlaeota bacterium]|nr:hypothetical protein [Candidatus Sumerlaeota bacterium]
MSPDTIRSAFTMAAWGMVLALFDFSFNGVVLTPDFIGYILMAVGLGKLESLASQFGMFSRLAWILAPLSLGEYLKTSSPDLALVFLLLGLAVAVLQFVLLFSLCSAVEEAALRAKCQGLVDRAVTCRALVLIFLVLGLVILAVVSLRLVDLVIPVVIIGFIYSVVLIVMLFLMLTWAGRELSAESLTT